MDGAIQFINQNRFGDLTVFIHNPGKIVPTFVFQLLYVIFFQNVRVDFPIDDKPRRTSAHTVQELKSALRFHRFTISVLGLALQLLFFLKIEPTSPLGTFFDEVIFFYAALRRFCFFSSFC
jgi:hypothetical protein